MILWWWLTPGNPICDRKIVLYWNWAGGGGTDHSRCFERIHWHGVWVEILKILIGQLTIRSAQLHVSGFVLLKPFLHWSLRPPGSSRGTEVWKHSGDPICDQDLRNCLFGFTRTGWIWTDLTLFSFIWSESWDILIHGPLRQAPHPMEMLLKKRNAYRGDLSAVHRWDSKEHPHGDAPADSSGVYHGHVGRCGHQDPAQEQRYGRAQKTPFATDLRRR